MNIAGEGSALAQLNPLGGMDIAVHPAMHNHIPRFNIGAHAAVGADRQALPAQSDGAFHFAVDNQILTAGKLAFYHDGLADGGDFAAAQRIAAHGFGGT